MAVSEHLRQKPGPDIAKAVRRTIGPGEDGDHAWDGAGGRYFNAIQNAVCVVAVHHDRVCHVRQDDIIDKTPVARNKAPILAATSELALTVVHDVWPEWPTPTPI